VREDGAVVATVDLDRGACACSLSRGEDPRLFVVALALRRTGAIATQRAARRVPGARTRCRETLTR